MPHEIADKGTVNGEEKGIEEDLSSQPITFEAGAISKTGLVTITLNRQVTDPNLINRLMQQQTAAGSEEEQQQYLHLAIISGASDADLER